MLDYEFRIENFKPGTWIKLQNRLGIATSAAPVLLAKTNKQDWVVGVAAIPRNGLLPLSGSKIEQQIKDQNWRHEIANESQQQPYAAQGPGRLEYEQEGRKGEEDD